MELIILNQLYIATFFTLVVFYNISKPEIASLPLIRKPTLLNMNTKPEFL